MIKVFNIIWFVFFGFYAALSWVFAGIIFYLTIIGIPIGKACFEFAKLSAFPYGKKVIKEVDLVGSENVHSLRKIGGFIMNLLWLPIGIIAFIYYVIAGVFAFISIIGIPIGIVYFKMSKFLLSPIGAKIVETEID